LLNFKKYKKFKIGLGKSIPLKVIEYTRNQLRSKKFNLGPGKKIRIIDFITYLENNEAVSVTDTHYQFQKEIGSKMVKFSLRKRSSDPFVYNQIIEMEEYVFLTDFLEDRDHSYTFMDIGANIGLTTLYMKAFFPNAKIYSLEPEPSSFHCLKNHIELNHLSSVSIFNKGLYISDGVLYANRSFRDGEHWSFKLDETQVDPNAEKLEVTSLGSLVKECNVNEIDFLKIDIEGGELALLKDGSFLQLIGDQVKIIMMEIHPEIISYQEAKSILRKNGFLVFDIGGSSVGLNRRLVLGKNI
jgi:FkbM family methyltransferase